MTDRNSYIAKFMHCDYLRLPFNQNSQLGVNSNSQGTALMFQSIVLLGS